MKCKQKNPTSFPKKFQCLNKLLFWKIPQKKPFPDINHLLHYLRSSKLANLPKGITRLVSAGCASTWYFNWIEEMYGPIKSHTGVEFYAPKPADLPKNVQWVTNSAGHMPDVPDRSADALISGQNLEHLWPEEVTGFLLESHRILDEHGLLQIDSPNRAITSQLNWSHPEHTVELTVSEIKTLCTLAGFDVIKCLGIWLCKTPKGKKLLPFEQMKRFGKMRMAKRIRLSNSYPELSFIWWIEARKSSRLPKVNKLKSTMNDIFSKAWAERCQRMLTVIGVRDGMWFDSEKREGVLMYGPYMPLRKGTYTVSLHLKCDLLQIKPNISIGTCDVFTDRPLCSTELVNFAHDKSGYFTVQFTFTLSSTTFGLQYRVISVSGISLRVYSQIDIQPSNSTNSDMRVCSSSLLKMNRRFF